MGGRKYEPLVNDELNVDLETRSPSLQLQPTKFLWSYMHIAILIAYTLAYFAMSIIPAEPTAKQI